jgi:hypothetical protein
MRVGRIFAAPHMYPATARDTARHGQGCEGYDTSHDTRFPFPTLSLLTIAMDTAGPPSCPACDGPTSTVTPVGNEVPHFLFSGVASQVSIEIRCCTP